VTKNTSEIVLVAKNIDWIIVAEKNVGQMKKCHAQNLDLSLF